MRSLTWEKRSLRLAIAIDSFIYFANVKPDHKYAFYGNTLAYVSGTETVTFWDTVTLQVKLLTNETQNNLTYLYILCPSAENWPLIHNNHPISKNYNFSIMYMHCFSKINRFIIK